MHPLKEPVPDCFPAFFFHKFWYLVGKDVMKMVSDVLNENKDPKEIINTFIGLILKHKCPTNPNDFHHINIYNNIMTMVKKTIINRLKGILLKIIDVEQSDFLKGCLITDNTLITMKLCHLTKKKKRKERRHDA